MADSPPTGASADTTAKGRLGYFLCWLMVASTPLASFWGRSPEEGMRWALLLGLSTMAILNGVFGTDDKQGRILCGVIGCIVTIYSGIELNRVLRVEADAAQSAARAQRDQAKAVADELETRKLLVAGPKPADVRLDEIPLAYSVTQISPTPPWKHSQQVMLTWDPLIDRSQDAWNSLTVHADQELKRKETRISSVGDPDEKRCQVTTSVEYHYIHFDWTGCPMSQASMPILRVDTMDDVVITAVHYNRPPP